MRLSFYRVRMCALADGQRIPLLVDDRTDLPVEATTRFTLAQRWQAGNSPGTAENELRAIGYFFSWAERAGIALDRRIASGDLLSQDELERLAGALRESQTEAEPDPEDKILWVGVDRASRRLSRAESSALRVVGNGTWHERISSVARYLGWLIDHAISHLHPEDDRFFAMRVRRAEVIEKLQSLLPSVAERPREGLPPLLRARLLEIIRPDSPENPFQAESRYRNCALLRLPARRPLGERSTGRETALPSPR
jgi:hypothetical protein